MMNRWLTVLAIVTLGWPHLAVADSGDLLLQAPYQGIAPEGITRDASDGTLWVPSYIDGEVRHFDDQLNLIGSFPNPFFGSDGFTGIAYYPTRDSLLCLEPLSFRLLEVDKTGAPIAGGIDLTLPLLPVVNPLTQPFPRGIAFYPLGDSGNGSLFVVENIGALIYEFDLLGNIIRTFEHPDDPDGYPGSGSGAPTGGIALLTNETTGLLEGIDLVGKVGDTVVAHRLDTDGNPTGYQVSLESSAAGAVPGIVRAPWTNPDTGTTYNVLVGTGESNATVFIVDGDLPPIAELLDFECESADDQISLSWSLGQTYDEIRLLRNGDLLAVLAGDATSWTDTALSDQVYRYAVYGVEGPLATAHLDCVDVVGAGQVLDQFTLPDIEWAIDLTIDDYGVIWIAADENRIWGYDFAFDAQFAFDGPFTLDDDELTGIAWRPETDTVFVYNAFDNTFVELDYTGTPVGAPVTAQIPVVVDDEPWVGSLVYDPNGNGGDGELFALDVEHAIIYRLARDGTVLGSFVHPEEQHSPTPEPSGIDHYMLGMSAVPDVGTGFEQLDLVSGSLFNRRSDRILRVDSSSGTPVGFQLPLAGVNKRRPASYYACYNSEESGQAIAFVIALRFEENVLFKVKRDAPPVLPIDFLECAQPTLVNEAAITFTNHGPYDSIDVERDGSPLTSLPGDATSFTDTTASPGMHHYRLTPVLSGVAAAPRDCELRVGPGAILKRKIIYPVPSPYQMTRDQNSGHFFVNTNSSGAGDTCWRFDENLQFVGDLSAATEPPWLQAAIAIRNAPTGDEIWTISWLVPAPWLQEQEFLLTVQNLDGSFVSLPTTISIPGAGVGVALTYPTGLTWDSASDTFWFLERNTDTFWQMDLNGELLQSLPHPMPPLQDFVFNLGLRYEPSRQSFTATTAGPFDHEITRAIGIAEDGTFTGEVIPLDDADLSTIYGMDRDDARLWVTGWGPVAEMLEVKAADDVDHPTTLSCVESAPFQVTLTWEEPVGYDSVVIRRSGVEIAVLPGGIRVLTDSGVPVGPRAYTVAGRIGGEESSQVACALVLSGGGPVFIRGDASGDAVVDIADAVFLLNYLFVFGPTPSCLDAADTDDTGVIDITDPVFLLAYLFTSGPQPPSPFPDPGADPSGDSLDCGL